jgi:branched-chain amino acid aminotransferase
LQVLKTQLEAKEQGYDDVVYLDAVSDTYLEEVSSCNIFVVNVTTIKTPPLQVNYVKVVCESLT